MDLAIANLLAKGAVREVQSQDDQFTSTYFWYKKKMASFGQLSYLRALNRFLGKESFKMKGLQVVIYIDDMLLLHQQSQVLQTLFAQVVAFLENLGFQVKMEKCSVAPSQCIVFLGAQLYSTTVTLSLPQLKLSSILGDCQLLLELRAQPYSLRGEDEEVAYFLKATSVDAFSMSWHNPRFYAFPRFSLILKCLRKIEEE